MMRLNKIQSEHITRMSSWWISQGKILIFECVFEGNMHKLINHYDWTSTTKNKIKVTFNMFYSLKCMQLNWITNLYVIF